ncbi:ABC transporter ATP-binding protein OS=Streptomyces tendae OX=1932 GN=F3L20_06270 PE=4 SV=1 [Streptomyces tendae]
MKSLAEQGRTVFVSSHLMSEMALTADHLVVIGQGRLLADTSMARVHRARTPVSTSGSAPRSGRRCSTRCTGAGVTVVDAADGTLEVDGTPPRRSASWPPATASCCTN